MKHELHSSYSRSVKPLLQTPNFEGCQRQEATEQPGGTRPLHANWSPSRRELPFLRRASSRGGGQLQQSFRTRRPIVRVDKIPLFLAKNAWFQRDAQDLSGQMSVIP